MDWKKWLKLAALKFGPALLRKGADKIEKK